MWNPVENETLYCRENSRQEGVEYDKHTTGIFKSGDKLVGHMIELSNLIDYFLGNTEENQVFAVVAG